MDLSSKYRCAAALQYDASIDGSPFVSVCEEGGGADLVVKIAKKYGIPVVEKPSLARSLLLLEEGCEVPSELFRAIAVVFHEVEKLLTPR